MALKKNYGYGLMVFLVKVRKHIWKLKKNKGITYKRRLEISFNDLMTNLNTTKQHSELTQIQREIIYCKEFYKNIRPVIYLAYERAAYHLQDDKDFRITFDRNIVWRDNDLFLTAEIYGERLFDEELTVMEIKVKQAFPLWLANLLSENQIYAVPFSKYGTIYKKFLMQKNVNQVNEYFGGNI